jgi:Na+/H+-dicarboxylate symporter
MDMPRTAVNIVDDATAAVLIAKTEGEPLPDDLLVAKTGS